MVVEHAVYSAKVDNTKVSRYFGEDYFSVIPKTYSSMFPRASDIPSFLRILVRALPIIADDTSKMSATSFTENGIIDNMQTLNSLSVIAGWLLLMR